MMQKAEKRENARLFADALIEAFDRKFNDALLSSADTSVPNNSIISFEREYRRLLSSKRRRRVMLIAAVLAVLMLCGCTVYVYRERIAEFLIEHTPVSTVVISEAKNVVLPEVVPCYGLSYVPEGYKLVERKPHYVNARTEWQNEEGNTIEFKQFLANSPVFYNNKGDAVREIEHNGRTILCISANYNYYSYLWENGSYFLSIASSIPLPEDELLRMIDSIVITEYITAR